MELDSRKQFLQEKLQKREEDRITEAEKRKEEKASQSSASENVGSFERKFEESIADIEAKLEMLKVVGDDNKIAAQGVFDELLFSLQKVQKYLTDSTFYLTSYMIERCQLKISKLQQSIQGKREEIIPKKKFAFRGKKKTADVGKNIAAKSEVDGILPTPSFASYDCGFTDRQSEALVLNAEECNFKDVAISRLHSCQVRLYGSPGAVHITAATDCTIFCGPCSGSIFVDGCTDCTLVLACQQLRIHSSRKVKFYIHVTSKAIIEDCSEVVFAPYAWKYDELDKHYLQSKLNRMINNWDDIDDFNWLASDQASPNWSIMKPPDNGVQFY